MHIAEGILSPAVLGAGALLAAAGTAAGLRRTGHDRLMLMGTLSAAFFVASLIHVPIGAGSAHLLGNGLLGVFLGWGCFPAILVALLLQALLFQFGGLTTLGVNTCSMAFGGVLASYCFQCLTRLSTGKAARSASAFLCGALGVAFAALIAALALSSTNEGFRAPAMALLAAHLPVMLAEGAITMFATGFIARVRPEMLRMSAPSADQGGKA